MRKVSVYPALQISPPHLSPGTGHMNKENRLKKDTLNINFQNQPSMHLHQLTVFDVDSCFGIIKVVI